MNQPQFFELQADDVTSAKGFYEQVFGWQFAEQPGQAVEYWRITTEGIDGGLLNRPAAISNGPSGTNAATISMQVESFKTIAEHIIGNGGHVTLPRFAVPGRCWQSIS